MYPKSFRYKLYGVFALLLVFFSYSIYFSWQRKESSLSPDNAIAENLGTVSTPTKIPILTPAPNLNAIAYVKTAPPIVPSSSPSPLPTATLTQTKSSPILPPTTTVFSTPTSVLVNGFAPELFIYLPAKTISHCKEILAQGKGLERNPNRFSKVGDSIVDTDQFFTVFDTDNYQIEKYQYLESVIDHYAGAFGRSSVAVRDGLNSMSVMDPMWANKETCNANEMPLACEIRLNNPSLILVHFGTNDWTEAYENNMRQIIEFSISEGVIPVLITKANRIDKNNQRNDILRQLAAEYHIPLWDFDVIAGTLPNRGLAQDEAHLSVANNFDYTDSQNLTQGYEAFNLTGLLFLDAFLREVVYNGT